MHTTVDLDEGPASFFSVPVSTNREKEAVMKGHRQMHM